VGSTCCVGTDPSIARVKYGNATTVVLDPVIPVFRWLMVERLLSSGFSIMYFCRHLKP